ncbi:zinc finger protein Xfin isoform X1 [Hydra vulgaris]|uniref:zinc finger protein Xfin isoform X1 n=2 Tax=Hydra vulgaris TaxID=6087 RepID=UPI0001926B69|nr:zinc finger protein Xfin isoform X1 [Hydra vulgaris]
MEENGVYSRSQDKFVNLHEKWVTKGNISYLNSEREEYTDGNGLSTDYDLSLQIENIKLKSKLEQANANIMRLLKEKDDLQEELHSTKTTYHHLDIKGVVQKLEQEIYVLEEQLDRQRKHYNQEHTVLNNELKLERKKQEEWKSTYLKSQVAIMSFRRKIATMKDRISFEDRAELSRCLEIVMESDLDISSNRDPNADHNKNVVNHKMTEQSSHHKDGQSKYNTQLNHQMRVSNELSNKYPPSVIILDEKNSFNDNNSPTIGNELDNGFNKSFNSIAYGFSQKVDIESGIKQENQPVYKHWHNYDSHNYPRFIDKRNVSQKPNEFKSKESNGSYLDINANKFLELKFDSSAVNPDYTSKEQTKSTTVEPSHSQSSPSKRIVNEGKVPAGTPLAEHRKWCLTCDVEVTKKSCGHQNLITQTNVKEFPCPTCSRVFNNRSHLKRHNMIHSGEKPWPCSYCEKRFNRKSHLTRHLLTHTGEKPFKCPICSKGFADNSDLKRHRQTHLMNIPSTATSPTTLTVSVSSPSFPDSTYSSRANSLVTILPKLSKLDSQNADSLSSGNLSTTPSIENASLNVLDKKERKKGDPRFPCNKCHKVFTRKSHLTRHKLTHDLEKIYCDCGRVFKQKSHMQAHLPSCKRRRDAIEAKYKAEHGECSDLDLSTSMVMNSLYSSNTSIKTEQDNDHFGENDQTPNSIARNRVGTLPSQI